MNKILICGYYGFKNVGDEAILQATIDNLKTIDSNIDISVLTYNAEYTKYRYDVNAVSRSKLFDIVKTIKNCDLMMYGGGSLLQDVTSSKSLLFYLGLISIAKLFGKKVMFYCNGYGPVDKKVNQLLIKWILKKVNLITLRDEGSKKKLKELGINKNIKVTADAAFTMKPADKKKIKEIFEYESIPTDKDIIGISIRKWKDNKQIREVISKTIDYISNKGINVVLIPMKYPDDLEFSLEVKEMCKSEPYVIQNYYEPKEVLGIIGEFSMMIGIRLHSLIFASMQSVPIVGIEYDPKVKAFVEAVEQKNAGSIEKLDVASLCMCIDEVYDNREKYIKKMDEKREYMKEKVILTAKEAIELLNKSV